MAKRRLQITHRTGYKYADIVDASFNEVRMTPLSLDGQTLINHSLDVQPHGAIQRYVDYWGAQVEAFDVHVPHRILEITATSTVESAGLPEYGPGVDWHDLHQSRVRDQFAEFLMPTNYVDLDVGDDCREIVGELKSAQDPIEAAHIAISRVREHMTYETGSTEVSTTAQQAWESGRGVCQDFTHTTLALLRSVGIPGRYVSGYLHCEDDAFGQTVTGESHAWVEFWSGDWRALDPTNDRAVDGAHVFVARGRDYADVPPLKGLYAGGHSEELGVSVSITQL
jgi:transglutaminase-like putative cysteine protease